MLSISFQGLDAVDARFSAFPAELMAALGKTSNQLADALLDKIKFDKLAGDALQLRSGALAASITTEVTADSDSVMVSAGSSGVPYAAIQEYGGRTAAHEILPSKAQALAYLQGGALRFARRVEHPGSKIPERSYLRSSLAELGDAIETQFAEAAQDAWSRT